MSLLNAFHDVRFPTDLAFGSTGGPQRRTEIVTLGSGKEQRNSRWANSRRRYNVGYGVKTIQDLQEVIAFFEERRGRLFGFRFRDPLDWKSALPGDAVSPGDQQLGEGDGARSTFPLTKRYGSLEVGFQRTIYKPILDTLHIAIDGVELPEEAFSFIQETGSISFSQQSIPDEGAIITAGYEFDVPVRFDTDEILVNLAHFEAGDIPTIPLVELVQ